ncbi:type III pantothenate kinase [Flavobacteriaceae bacterium TK19130]|nr:type III pantothenate kinase [Thermobacterium salinum]
MNLIIDVGNTLIKLAVFENGTLRQRKTAIKGDFPEALAQLERECSKITHCIVAATGKFGGSHLEKLQKRYSTIVLSSKTPLPFKNEYKTPDTLGVDRIALVAAAMNAYPSKNALVIDAGTCITYDFISSDSEYLGGAISPGLEMRYKALHTFTHKLPLLEATAPKGLIGGTTASSIHSGIVFGIIAEIEGIINRYISKYSDLVVVLTGGDAQFLRDRLKSDIFAHSNFLLEGLNYILDNNKH